MSKRKALVLAARLKRACWRLDWVKAHRVAIRWVKWKVRQPS